MRSEGKFFALRLPPHADLRRSLLDFAQKNSIKAAAIVTCVGSLDQCNLRFADQKDGKVMKGFYEILSLSGTLGNAGCHLHLCVSDKEGRTMGGHLLDENLIYTTAEIVIVELIDVSFDREVDDTYGYSELVVKPAVQ